MTLTPDEFADLRGLIDRVCEELVTADEMRQLENYLRADPAAEAFYVQVMAEHADLRRRLGRRPVPNLPLPAPRGWRWAAGGLAALAASVLAVLAWPTRPPTVDAPSGEATDSSVAVLASAAGAVWDGLPLRPGAPLRPGRLALQAGVARVEFYSGVVVILEGPAELDLVSAEKARCLKGKLHAQVPPRAVGFTVETPDFKLVDRGTEFGVSVGGGSAEVHCFRGKVDLFDPTADTGARELQTGQGVRYPGPGRADAIPADPGRFVGPEALAARAKAEARERLTAWKAAAKGWAADPAARLYLPFDDDEPDWEGRLPNRAAGAAEGIVIGAEWADGRWPGKKALEFKRVGDRVLLDVSGEFTAFTLVASVRADGLENRYNSLFLTDGWDIGSPHWHVSSTGELALGIRRPDRKGFNYVSPPVFAPARLGRWTHLAVTFDPAADRVTHYVDGEAVARVPIPVRQVLKFGAVELGNWNAAERVFTDGQPVRNFIGRIDEFGLFARALSDAEVRRHAEGKPAS